MRVQPRAIHGPCERETADHCVEVVTLRRLPVLPIPGDQASYCCQQHRDALLIQGHEADSRSV
jgi:hypothetical protein